VIQGRVGVGYVFVAGDFAIFFVEENVEIVGWAVGS
jgi:hypothetical protein